MQDPELTKLFSVTSFPKIMLWSKRCHFPNTCWRRHKRNLEFQRYFLSFLQSSPSVSLSPSPRDWFWVSKSTKDEDIISNQHLQLQGPTINNTPNEWLRWGSGVATYMFTQHRTYDKKMGLTFRFFCKISITKPGTAASMLVIRQYLMKLVPTFEATCQICVPSRSVYAWIRQQFWLQS